MPVQRATSSEYISKHDRFPKDTADVAARAKTGIAKVVAAAPREDSGSGMFQLLICVGGIYASL